MADLAPDLQGSAHVRVVLRYLVRFIRSDLPGRLALLDRLLLTSVLHCFGMLVDGRAQPTGIRRRGADATLLIVCKAHLDVVGFTLPATLEGARWRALIDTYTLEETGRPAYEFGDRY
jgi:hypothetical protein